MKSLIIFFLTVTLAAANSKIEDRIFKGKNAAVGQFPYVVYLQFDGWFTCAGSLISSTWVLTSAPCTDGHSYVEVKLGAVDWNKPDLSFFVPKDKFVQHEDFIKPIGKNNIALIEIPRVKYTKNIQKIDLPRISPSYPEYTNESVVTLGYGEINDHGNDPSGLQYAEMRVISNEDCSKALDFIDKNIICAISNDSASICAGDSGGPLVLTDSKILIGFATFGKRVCEKIFPSGFTRVTSYLDWIAKHTGIAF